MKVLIATPYFSPKLGGLEIYAEHIATELVGQGWEVHIVTSGPDQSTRTSGGLTIHTLKSWVSISNTPVNPFWTMQAKRLIRQIQPDVINVHAPVPSMALAVALAAAKIPVVTTYHAGSMKKGSLVADGLIFIYEKLALPLLLEKSRHIICASDYVRLQFLDRWINQSTTVTPGVDTATFTPDPTRRVPGRILFVGDFRDPRKGLSHLIAAKRQLPNATLQVVGQGDGKPEPGINYLGVLTGPSLVHQMQAASLLVLPSTTTAESFGMVLIEAMACGTPVIGSNIGGIGYVIKPGVTGLLVPPADTVELASAIKLILTDTSLAKALSQAGRTEALERYSWATRGQQTHQILLEAIKSEVDHG